MCASSRPTRRKNSVPKPDQAGRAASQFGSSKACEAEALRLIEPRQDARGPRHVAAVLVAEGVDHATSVKWLELLKEIAPRVKQSAVLRDATIASGMGQLAAIPRRDSGIRRGVALRPVGVRDAGEIERAVTAFAREPNGGLIVPASPLSIVQRDLIITLAARHRCLRSIPCASSLPVAG